MLNAVPTTGLLGEHPRKCVTVLPRPGIQLALSGYEPLSSRSCVHTSPAVRQKAFISPLLLLFQTRLAFWKHSLLFKLPGALSHLNQAADAGLACLPACQLHSSSSRASRPLPGSGADWRQCCSMVCGTGQTANPSTGWTVTLGKSPVPSESKSFPSKI